MRAAPAVTVELGGSAAWLLFQACIAATAAAALGAWLLSRAGQPAAWGLLAAPPAGWLAWRPGVRARAALAWDGQQWLLDGAAAHVTVAMDLGPWMLLRLQAAGGPARTRWWPATARQGGAHWHGLRAALYSRAPEAALAAAPSQRVAAPD
jgi:hypothetical protein